MKNQARNRVHVLDSNHGIEHRVSIYKLNDEMTAAAMVYVPWYYSESKQATFYYTHTDNWWRVECDTWLKAFDYIARSRRMPTSKHIGSSYVQEAKYAGVPLDVQTTSKPDEITTL